MVINCKKCKSEYVYEDGGMYICPMCSFEWSVNETTEEKIYKDANGNILVDGDDVVVVKDMKVKGSSNILKIGTKVKNIKLVDADHDISCKIPGWGQMKLKTSIVKKN